MAKLTWDETGKRFYETGVDHGVLFLQNSQGGYTGGVAWNGLTAVTESPTGAEANPQYADNIKYLNLISVEEFGATIEAFTYPDEFAQCDGTATPSAGVAIGQQTRKTFGFAYRTKLGNDLDGSDYGYKLHLIYGAIAAPSEKAYATVNDSPEALTFSWEITTTPVDVPGFKPTAQLTIDSTKVNALKLADLENLLYGTDGVDPVLPLPADVLDIFSDGLTEVTPVAPSFDAGTNTITIPVVTGVVYKIGGTTKTGTVVITKDTVVNAVPAAGYKFPVVTDDDWLYIFD
jgi:hypothetical protein